MSDHASYNAVAASQFDLFPNNDFTKRQQQQQYQQAFDFSYHASADPLAPLPDEFESDLDALAGLDDINLELLTVENNAFQFLRSDTPTCGPPSTITASSESAYDSLSAHSESLYDFAPYSTYSYPLEMDFQRIAVDPYASAQAQAQALNGLDSVDPTAAFGVTLPPTPPRSPSSRGQVPTKYRSSYSDCGPSRDSIPDAYYTQLTNYGVTYSPTHVNSPLPVVPSIPLIPSSEEYKGDPRKKYKCSSCPRGMFIVHTTPLDVLISCRSFRQSLQLEDPHVHARSQQTQAPCLSSPRLWAFLQPQARSWPSSNQYPS